MSKIDHEKLSRAKRAKTAKLKKRYDSIARHKAKIARRKLNKNKRANTDRLTKKLEGKTEIEKIQYILNLGTKD